MTTNNIDHGAGSRSAHILVLAQVLSIALSFPASLLVARSLGPAGLGEWAAIVRTMALVITLASLSLGHAFAYQWAAGAEDSAEVTGTALRLAGVQSVLLVTSAAILVWLATNGTFRIAWLIYLGYIPINLITLYGIHCLRAKLAVRAFAVARVLSAGAWLLLMAAATATGHPWGLAVIAAMFVLSQSIAAIYCIVAMRKRGWLGFGFSRRRAREAMRYGLRAHPGLTLQELNLYIDQVVIAIFLPSIYLGYYAVAASAAGVLAATATAFMYIAQPHVQSAVGPEREQRCAQLAALTVVIMTPLVVLAIVVVPQMIRIFYGSSFSGAATSARWLCGAALADSLATTLTGCLLGLNAPGASSRGHLVAAIATLIGLAFLLGPLGIVGASITSLCAYTIAALSLGVLVARRLDISAFRFVRLILGYVRHPRATFNVRLLSVGATL